MIKACPFRCGWELEYSVGWEGHAEITLRDHLDDGHPGWSNQPGTQTSTPTWPDWLPPEYPGDSPPLIVSWLLAHPHEGLEEHEATTAVPARSRARRAEELVLALVMTASMVWLSLKLLGVI